MAEVASVQSIQSIAASGTAQVVLPVPQNTTELVIQVAATYAAVSATASGVSANYSQSTNNGVGYVTSNQPAIKVAPAAGVVGSGLSIVRLGAGEPYRLDTVGAPDHFRVNLTNTDGTNAATVAVLTQALSHQP